ncbi:MAG: tol-pal system protein YbgF [Motiliproteus sp.]
MIRPVTKIVAVLLGGFYVPLVLAASGVPVVDRTESSPSSVAEPVALPVAGAGASYQPGPSSSVVAVVPGISVSANAELLMMLDQLQEEVRFLRGQVEEQQNQLRRLQVNQRDRYRDLDRRLSLLNQRPADASGVSVAALPRALPSTHSASATGSAVVTPASRTQTSAATGALASADVSAAQAYKAAFSLVREGDFDQALAAFEGFLQQYPGSSLTANVLYWTGEVHRAKPAADQQRARLAYEQLLARYPDHPKAAEAFYKLGLSYQEMGQLDNAKDAMSKVIELFPDQAPAGMARDFLQQYR